MLFKLLKTYLFRWFLNRSVYLRFFSLFSDSSRFPKNGQNTKKRCPSQSPYFLKNLTSQSKCLEKRSFCEFIPLDRNETFSFYHFLYTRRYTLFKKDGVWLGHFFCILAVSWNRELHERGQEKQLCQNISSLWMSKKPKRSLTLRTYCCQK